LVDMRALSSVEVMCTGSASFTPFKATIAFCRPRDARWQEDISSILCGRTLHPRPCRGTPRLRVWRAALLGILFPSSTAFDESMSSDPKHLKCSDADGAKWYRRSRSYFVDGFSFASADKVRCRDYKKDGICDGMLQNGLQRL
jgi:hypothetical protein